MRPVLSISGNNELVTQLVAVGHRRVHEDAELAFDEPAWDGIVGRLPGMSFVIKELKPEIYAVSATHEVAATVAELLLAELGIQAIHVAQDKWPEFLAGLVQIQQLEQMRDSARALLQPMLGDITEELL
ncbi:hypothetical protein [Corynebacterium pseudotuberculosis]|uniref:Uncharacterized protein n=1 Tax=Corynebacterium pseudotuberculosis (strain C231) TaxID=681645 RepID=D9QCF7_CORP2|nr:hypothetical protein [Corynebacterium pseudotuberculosis]ADL11233.1 hypothetical protein CPC231_09040 [Corynebacterium pseudotuberculosis C231]ADL21652.1 hypothetical protein CP1002_04105 [Corynebacterium pseudotuberculosis 1002]ADO27044.1 hypothetical protein CPI19_09050 [Corynebacterium pseudotuberculosis I19]AEK93108.1 Hypothetical protein CpPAT10_1787 [Corynebacterium pseudotuberculosis PAT10]AEP71015.1 Hypothetical protein Cp4202_1776 [Corynebacterium pseudotuberculosis 42/02-A]